VRIDAPGLIAAAQRLGQAVAAVAGVGVGHPPLAGDPASGGAAIRLTTAGAELTVGLAAHVAALLATIEALTGAAVTFTGMDELNKAVMTLSAGKVSGVPAPGLWAPPAPAVPPDVRAPLPVPLPGPPEAISAAAHSGDPAAGEPFAMGWAQVHTAARDAAEAVRATVTQLPDTLDAPVSTQAVRGHLLSFATGLDTYADRAHNLVTQANAHAQNQIQAREAIPTPQQLATAQQNVQIAQANNLASGGRLAVPLARAVAVKTALDNRVVSGYGDYAASTDAATAGQEPGSVNGGQPGDPATPPAAPGARSATAGAGPGAAAGAGPGAAPGAGPGAAAGAGDPTAAPSADQAGEMASMLPQMIPTVLGAVGGLAGGLLGAVTKVPETLMQAATQAAGEAVQSLQGLAQPKLDTSGNVPGDGPKTGEGTGDPGGVGDPGGAGGAGDTPAGLPPPSVAPSTGSAPTPAVVPAGASGPAEPAGAGPGGGAMPMGMPMGGLGGLAGQPGGGQDEPKRARKVVVPPIPHTEDVTGRVDTDRLAAAAAATRARITDADDDDNPPGDGGPIVRRLVTKPPEEPT
jgi:hypothetical protein